MTKKIFFEAGYLRLDSDVETFYLFLYRFYIHVEISNTENFAKSR